MSSKITCGAERNEGRMKEEKKQERSRKRKKRKSANSETKKVVCAVLLRVRVCMRVLRTCSTILPWNDTSEVLSFASLNMLSHESRSRYSARSRYVRRVFVIRLSSSTTPKNSKEVRRVHG